MDGILPNAHAVYLNHTSAKIMRHPTEKFHSHGEYELYYLFSGERKMLFENGIEYHLRAGEMMLIPPNLAHSTYDCSEFVDHDRVILNFEKQYIHNIIEQVDNFDVLPLFFPHEHVLRISDKKRETIELLIESLCKEMVLQQCGYELIARNTLNCILMYVMRARDYAETMRVYEKPDLKNHLYRMVEFVFNNYSDELSLKLLARLFYSDVTTVSKEFKAITGLNFIDYLNNRRLEVAKDLLLNSRLPVIQIAMNVGYNSATYFERVFKKKYGVTPKTYRTHQTGHTHLP